ncbi:brain protein I3 [Ditylenchus destructor]|nr:brain protein I3 [Ditylenchus destructor]
MAFCPVCKQQVEEKFTWRGILWAIFCFPCGMFCCFRRTRLRCPHCGFELIVSNGGVPSVARAYKSYGQFKWQFLFSRNNEQPESNGVNFRNTEPMVEQPDLKRYVSSDTQDAVFYTPRQSIREPDRDPPFYTPQSSVEEKRQEREPEEYQQPETVQEPENQDKKNPSQ